jgi:Trypsin-co-occurring domain 1
MAVVAFPSDSGDVVVEVDEVVSPGLQRVSGGKDGIVRLSKTFESALDGIKRVASAVVRTLDEIGPDEAAVEIGFKLSAESGVVLAKASAESQIVLKLTWKRPRGESSAASS